MTTKSLTFLQINELNFDLVDMYANKYNLDNLKVLLSWKNSKLTSEDSYEHLEPWIQWVSVATGLEANEHEVFRLGDAENLKVTHVYEEVENLGFSVIGLCPINVRNNLRNSKFFLPDPWTQTAVIGNWLDKKIHAGLRQAVNDNSSGKITFDTAFFMLIGIATYSRFKSWPLYAKLAFSAKVKKWNKALLLDLFLCDYFFKKRRSISPDLNILFLNSLAHIQHHYLKNSEFYTEHGKNPEWLLPSTADPMLDGLKALDFMISDLLKSNEADVLVATGLSQKIYTPFQYYYRVKNHEHFLNMCKITFSGVLPRMTRDFEIQFTNNDDRDRCAISLSKITISGVKCFGIIDKRPLSLFVTLTYDGELLEETVLNTNTGDHIARDILSFVALKNGEHSTHSWVFSNGDISSYLPSEGSHVKMLYYTLLSYFTSKTER